MADSNITKRALAFALKELMLEVPFDKINVAQICEKCGMNRKSFYYHFKDKYDLVNWIYDTEFIALASQKEYPSSWNFLEDLCHYLYDNRNFYRRALKIKGQNSFSDHFTELFYLICEEHLRAVLGKEMNEFQIWFVLDAFINCIKRWILEMNDVNPDEFIILLKSIIYQTATKIYHEINEKEEEQEK